MVIERRQEQKDRSLIIFSLFIGAFFVLLVRLAVVQLLQGDVLRKRAESQGVLSTRLLPWRGTIYDRNGGELAISVSADSIYIRPGEVEKPDEVVSELAEVLGEKPAVIRKKVASSIPFVWVKRKVEKKRAAMLGDISGVGKVEESKRFYPAGMLASHLIGFAGIDNYGLEGIELAFDRCLRGIPGYLRSKEDARGREIAALRRVDTAAYEGKALVLTIDEVIQYIVERELDRAYYTKFAGLINQIPAGDSKIMVKSAIAIVMRPATGEILALANRPAFDPANLLFSSADERRNRAITDIFEPGSCFKIIPAAAALEEKLFKPSDMIFCENGAFRVAGHTVHDVHPYDSLTFSQVLEKSSNIGMGKIGIRLGKMTFYRYMRKFGFGEKTGCDLPGEVTGLLRHPRRWSKLCNCVLSFGQGVGVTSLQLISAFSTVANGGILMRPMVVKSFIDNGIVLENFEPHERRRVISKESAGALTEILVRAVENGTGKRARIPGYKVAGKTGTAQKVVDGTYSHTKFVSSFVGYVPAHKPEIAVLVVVDEPSGKPHECYGGRVAGPVFREIAVQTLRYLGIAPDGSETRFVRTRAAPRPVKRKFPHMAGVEAVPGTAKVIAINGNTYYEVECGMRSAERGVWNTETELVNGEYLTLKSGTDVQEISVLMPDVCGMTMREVLRWLAPYHLGIKFRGSGIAVKQFPRAGRKICPGTECLITFR